VKEDVLYNWTDSTTMIVSSSRKPFRAGNEMHPLTLEALIGACSKLKSFVVNFATSTCMYCYTHLLHWIFIPEFHLTFSTFQVIMCWHVAI
jgi:hypothetical protein